MDWADQIFFLPGPSAIWLAKLPGDYRARVGGKKGSNALTLGAIRREGNHYRWTLYLQGFWNWHDEKTLAGAQTALRATIASEAEKKTWAL